MLYSPSHTHTRAVSWLSNLTFMGGQVSGKGDMLYKCKTMSRLGFTYRTVICISAQHLGNKKTKSHLVLGLFQFHSCCWLAATPGFSSLPVFSNRWQSHNNCPKCCNKQTLHAGLQTCCSSLCYLEAGLFHLIIPCGVWGREGSVGVAPGSHMMQMKSECGVNIW